MFRFFIAFTFFKYFRQHFLPILETQSVKQDYSLSKKIAKYKDNVSFFSFVEVCVK